MNKHLQPNTSSSTPPMRLPPEAPEHRPRQWRNREGRRRLAKRSIASDSETMRLLGQMG